MYKKVCNVHGCHGMLYVGSGGTVRFARRYAKEINEQNETQTGGETPFGHEEKSRKTKNLGSNKNVYITLLVSYQSLNTLGLE